MDARSILLAIMALGLEVSASSCTWTAPTGHTYDLSGLKKDDHWMIEDGKKRFKYYLNVCADAKPPKECETQHVVESAGYQVEARSWRHLCKSIGRKTAQTFNLLDPKDPQKGVEVTYGGGAKCGGTDREVRLHLICSPHFDAGPLQIFETTKSCHYNVTWASKYGCPKGSGSWFGSSTSSSTSSSSTTTSSWSFGAYFRLFLVAFVAYVVGGCIFLKYTNPEIPIGLGTCPNVNFWISAFDMSLQGGTWIFTTIKSKVSGKQEPEEDFDDKYPMNKDKTEDDYDEDEA
mmetsp:Transcript_6728/g.10298  ORF Transcript_6728/g.10298 Transcript_6728/m.10298 type:complete len:289 (-) Transcript_6728:205-1071(-)